MDVEIEHKIERYKSITEYIKHLTTLSTGSIVLISAFLEKLFLKPEWKSLVAVALFSFMLSVISSVITYTLLITDFPPRQTQEKSWEKPILGMSLLMTWVGFLAGIISLTLFALKNFL